MTNLNSLSKLGLSLISGLAVLVQIQGANAGEEVIYGPDNRKETYEVKDLGTLQRADSVVALIKREQISMVAASRAPARSTSSAVAPRGVAMARITAAQFGQGYGLCANERYRDQPIAGFCSGSLIGPDLVLTAGHCVKDMTDCQGINFVFNYKMAGPGAYPTAVPASEVYGCRTIVARKLEQGRDRSGQATYGADFAIIQLDRVVANHRPLPINHTAQPIRVGTPLVMIGHPAGLPQKIENGGRVRDNQYKAYFNANTDSYGGNSGSAVFNGQTGVIEGVLVRGEEDFITTPQGCRISNVCADGGCRGESITRASEFTPILRSVARRGR